MPAKASVKDFRMARDCTDRCTGNGVSDSNFVDGKLDYLAATGLDLMVKHQDDVFGDEDIHAHGLVSYGMGKPPTADFIVDEFNAGEDVELGYSGGTGGHWVVVVGAGSTLGTPWVYYQSDHLQSDADNPPPPGGCAGTDGIDDNEGTGLVDYSELEDNADPDLMLNLKHEPGEPNVDIVVSESLRHGIPTVSEWGLIVMTLLVLTAGTVVLGRRRRAAA